MKTTKILVSPGFGAGWTSWCYTDDMAFRKFMLTYAPLIAAVESRDAAAKAAALVQFEADVRAQFPEEDGVYLGGARDLVVREVSEPFVIEEYDGSESVVTQSHMNWISFD